MPSIGPLELAFVLIIALLVLGPKRLPDAARSLGEGVRSFKESLSVDNKPDDHQALSRRDANSRYRRVP